MGKGWGSDASGCNMGKVGKVLNQKNPEWVYMQLMDSPLLVFLPVNWCFSSYVIYLFTCVPLK